MAVSLENRSKEMSEKIAYWPGSGNECDEVKGCKGAGSEMHIDHMLAAMSVTKLMGAVLSHCGDNYAPFLSCMCGFYLRELGERATVKGVNKHRNAVEAKKAYFAKKYPSQNTDRSKKND